MAFTIMIRGVAVLCDKPEEARDLVACLAELREAEERILAKYSKPKAIAADRPEIPTSRAICIGSRVPRRSIRRYVAAARRCVRTR